MQKETALLVWYFICHIMASVENKEQRYSVFVRETIDSRFFKIQTMYQETTLNIIEHDLLPEVQEQMLFVRKC